MADYIKREDVLEFMRGRLDMQDEYLPIHFIQFVIDEMPAADVRENVKGAWVHLGGDEWLCNACGHVITTEGSWEHPSEDDERNFCENCGADMRKEKG